ncbi:unnamed protein product [Orchesella dallaii]|uniref:NYN domain-containing protein n=1 Tax=Orchesella dallaii TaxID=48710 RepID=A0ABP1QQ21_9HEXA
MEYGRPRYIGPPPPFPFPPPPWLNNGNGLINFPYPPPPHIYAQFFHRPPPPPPINGSNFRFPPGYQFQRPPPPRNINTNGYNHNHQPPQLPPRSVLLYIDNSNIFESAKKHSSQKKGYRSGIPDVACRIDIGKLISKSIQNRRLLYGKLYGSEPPALDSVWEAIRRKQVHVETFERSKWTLKEKETDSSLTADAVEDIITKKDEAGDTRTVILFSGDRDLLRVVDKAVKFGYRVEIWSFKSSINNTVRRRAQEESDKVIVNYIDDIFDDITYTKVVWGKKRIPPERSIVASVNLPEDLDKKKTLSTVVAQAGKIFQLPMMGKYLNNYKYIILVPCIKENYTPPASLVKTKQDTVRTYDFYKCIQPFLFQLKEFFPFCKDVIPWLKFVSDARSSSSPSGIISASRFALLRGDSGGETSSSEGDEDSELSEDFDCNDFYDFHHEDLSDLDDDFVPILRKETKPKVMYSTFCTYQYWCAKGSECRYNHTQQQKEFFKVQSDPKRRSLYKIKPCFFTPCQYAAKSYLCAYAHSVEESRCLCCKEKGSGQHWMDQCPINRKL